MSEDQLDNDSSGTAPAGPPHDQPLPFLAAQLGVSVNDLEAAMELSSLNPSINGPPPLNHCRLDTDAEIAKALELEEQQASSASYTAPIPYKDFIPRKTQLNLDTLLNLSEPFHTFIPTNDDLIEESNCRRIIHWTSDPKSRLEELWLTPFDASVHFDELQPSVVTRYQDVMQRVMTAMPLREKEALLHTIFGPIDGIIDRKAVVRWLRHAVIFANSDLCPWGLLQLTGGPCGVLAGLQSYVIQRLLYSPDGPKTPVLQRITSVNMEALKISFVQAITLLLRQATPAGNPYKVVWIAPIRASTAQCGSRLAELSLGDVQMETDRGPSWTDLIPELAVFQKTFNTAQELDRSCGLISLVASLVLTRGIEQMMNDFEGDSADQALIGRFGHCNQEIMNLMLVGRASSNPFDGDKTLGSDDMCVLKGIPRRCLTGYLSEMEVSRYCEVGEYLKTPYFPIWVIGINEHFTVLFTTDPNLTRTSEGEIAEMIGVELFNEIDLDSDGIVEATALDSLLALAEFTQDVKPEAERSLCPPYGGMVIIRADFVQFYLTHKTKSSRYLKAVEAEELLSNCSTGQTSSLSTRFPLVHYDPRVQTRLEQRGPDLLPKEGIRFDRRGEPVHHRNSVFPLISQPLVNLFTLQFSKHPLEVQTDSSGPSASLRRRKFSSQGPFPARSWAEMTVSKLVRTFTTASKSVFSVCVAPTRESQSALFLGCADGTILIKNLASALILHPALVCSAPNVPVISLYTTNYDDRSVLVSQQRGGHIDLWKLDLDRGIGPPFFHLKANGLAFSRHPVISKEGILQGFLGDTSKDFILQYSRLTKHHPCTVSDTTTLDCYPPQGKSSGGILMGVAPLIPGLEYAALFETHISLIVDLDRQSAHPVKLFEMNGTPTCITAITTNTLEVAQRPPITILIGSSQGDVCVAAYENNKLCCLNKLSIPKLLRLNTVDDMSGVFQCINSMLSIKEGSYVLLSLWNGLILAIDCCSWKLKQDFCYGTPSITGTSCMSSIFVDDEKELVFTAYGARGLNFLYCWRL